MLKSLPFDDEDKLENIITNKFEVSPYDLMFECCCKKNPKNRQKYEIINKCNNILDKCTNLEHIIKKNMEVDFLKEYILSSTEIDMFKYHFKNLNLYNFENTMRYLKTLRSEGVKTLTKEKLIDQVLNGKTDLFEVFYDYHTS